MSTDYEYAPSRPPAGRHAFEWGLSSLIIGSVLTMLFPVSLLVMAVGGGLAMNWRYWDADNLRLADVVAHVVGYMGVGAAILAVLFALFGLLRGAIGRQPLGACVGGLFVSLAAVVLMVMLTIIIGVVSKEFYKELPLRRPESRTMPMPGDGGRDDSRR
jgi:hypothetical protein